MITFHVFFSKLWRYRFDYYNWNNNKKKKFFLFFSRVGEDGHWDVKNAIITSNNETSYQVVGLYPFTVYSFRVVATNNMGPSQPSKESYYMVTLREGKNQTNIFLFFKKRNHF
mgnify:CR=1 FL=1